MKVRDLAALALIVAALGLERLAFFAGNTLLGMDLYKQGQNAAAIGQIFMVRQGLLVLGMFVGAAVAFAVGPRVTAAAGALVAAIGYVAMAAGGPLAGGVYLVSFGVGVLRPCPVVAAAAVLAWDDRSPAPPGPHRFAAVAAFFVSISVAANAGALIGSALAGLLGAARGSGLVYGAAGVLLLLSTALLAVAAVLGRMGRAAAAGTPAAGPYRDAGPASATAAPSGSTVLAGLAILLAPEVVYRLGVSLASPPPSLRLSASSTATLYAVNPIAVTVVSGLVFAVLLVAALQRWTRPPLLLCGVGMVVFSVGLAILAAGGTSLGLFGLGAVVTGAGEAAVSGVPIAYAAIAVRGRLATLVVTAWMTVGTVLSNAGSFLGSIENLRTPLLVILALLCLSAGAAFLRFGRELHRFFDPAPLS